MAALTVGQLRAARALLGLTQENLARRSRVGVATIKRLELGKGELGGRLDTGDKLQHALEVAGVEFIASNGGGPGVRLRKSRGAKR